MKKIILSTISAFAAVTTTSAASAADMAPVYKAPPVALYNWTGFYAGINGGGGWGRENWIDNAPTGVNPIGAVSHHPDGGMFGGQLGYRWQMNQFVFGVEGTWDWSGLKDVASGANPAGTVASEEFKIKSIYSVTGQIGWSMDRALLYVKGGWAGARTSVDFSLIGGPITGGFATASHSATANGWILGGGIDYAIWQNWTVGIEYDHLSLSYDNFTASVSNGGPSVIVVDTSRLTVDQVVGRLSYKFN